MKKPSHIKYISVMVGAFWLSDLKTGTIWLDVILFIASIFCWFMVGVFLRNSYEFEKLLYEVTDDI